MGDKMRYTLDNALIDSTKFNEGPASSGRQPTNHHPPFAAENIIYNSRQKLYCRTLIPGTLISSRVTFL